MDWTQAITIIASLMIPMVAGFGWLIHRMDDRFNKVEDRLSSLDQRLSKLEGSFEERGRWESRRIGIE